jgi:hypothetical protein
MLNIRFRRLTIRNDKTDAAARVLSFTPFAHGEASFGPVPDGQLDFPEDRVVRK